MLGRRVVPALLLVGWWAVGLSAQTTGVVSATPAAVPTPLHFGEVVEQARGMVQADLAKRGYPGIAIAVSVAGETVWSEGFGYADLEHRVPMWPSVKFRVGSISKSMTAAAAAAKSASARAWATTSAAPAFNRTISRRAPDSPRSMEPTISALSSMSPP